MKKLITTVLMIVFCLTLSSGVWANTMSFRDIEENDWYYDYVLMLTERNIVSGVSENQFMPEKSITRAEFAKILSNISQVDLSSYTEKTHFVDVDPGSWYAASVQWAYETGVVAGVNETRFAPNQFITREEAAVMLERFTKSLPDFVSPKVNEKIEFKDQASVSDWAEEAVSVLQQANIFCGDEKQYFNPQNNMQRCEAAKMMGVYYYYHLGYETEKYIEENQEELDAEIEAAQAEMKELSKDPNATQYFENSPISDGTISASGFSGGGFGFLDGDILYTNGINYVGHIGMACGTGILEIVGSGVQRVSYQSWANRYSDRYTYVLRRVPEYCGGDTNCRQVSLHAAWYGQSYFLNGAGRNYSYFLTASVNNTQQANCSGLIYKCYRDGAGFYYKIQYIPYHGGPVSYVNPSVITPNDILDARVYNGFSALHKF